MLFSGYHSQRRIIICCFSLVIILILRQGIWFLHCIVSIFASVLIIWGDTLNPCRYPAFIKISPLNLTHDNPVFALMMENQWFSTLALLPHLSFGPWHFLRESPVFSITYLTFIYLFITRLMDSCYSLVYNLLFYLIFWLKFPQIGKNPFKLPCSYDTLPSFLECFLTFCLANIFLAHLTVSVSQSWNQLLLWWSLVLFCGNWY